MMPSGLTLPDHPPTSQPAHGNSRDSRPWEASPVSTGTRARPAAVGRIRLETHPATLEPSLVIYGVSLLAGCLLAGLFLGDLLGTLIGVQANVGGVGLAMILLILLSDGLRRRGRLTPVTEQGVLFWSAIYIPVVVAMAAKQNVIAAVKGGPAAILAGVGAVALGFLLVPLLSRLGGGPPSARGPTTPTEGGGAGLAAAEEGTGSEEDHAVESHGAAPGEEGKR